MKPLQKPTPNYQTYVRMDTTAYKGEWIAISGKKVVSHGQDAQKVFKEAQRKIGKNPISLAKVPDKEMMIL